MDDFHCSFCGKRRLEVVNLISGPRVFICNECVARCRYALDMEKAGQSIASEQEAKDAQKYHCSFCGKSQDDVEHLIAGPTVYICTTCIDLCEDIIREEVYGAEPSAS